LEIISQIFKQTNDSSLLIYAMEAVIDSGFSLSYRDRVLRFIFPLIPHPTSRDGSPHVHALTRLLVTLGDPSLAVPLLVSLATHDKLLALQFSFDLVEGGARDFLDAVSEELPTGQSVRVSARTISRMHLDNTYRMQQRLLTRFASS
jgi:26S proteasome regulatory subunit N2